MTWGSKQWADPSKGTKNGQGSSIGRRGGRGEGHRKHELQTGDTPFYSWPSSTTWRNQLALPAQHSMAAFRQPKSWDSDWEFSFQITTSLPRQAGLQTGDTPCTGACLSTWDADWGLPFSSPPDSLQLALQAQHSMAAYRQPNSWDSDCRHHHHHHASLLTQQ